MYLHLTATAPLTDAQALLDQAAHVSGNLRLAGLKTSGTEAVCELQSYRPLTADTRARFEQFGAQRVPGLTVAYYSSEAAARAAGVSL